MQVFGLHKCIYKLNRVVSPEQKIDPYFLRMKERVTEWQKLKKYKIPDKEIARFVGISRASFYRHKKMLEVSGLSKLERLSRAPRSFRKSTIQASAISLILTLRKDNPTYGKAKIAVILKRDHSVTLSESSVGRVLKKLISQGKVVRSISSSRIKRKRVFKSHAKRWEYGMKSSSPGELIQIDHMTVSKHNVNMKEFSAWDPITKTMVADISSNASSSAAARFLRKVVKEMPFPVISVQVDGGSEFMAEFERECQKLNIPLFVLPPSRPQWNGGVERGNRTFREEFYARKDLEAESIGAFKYELQKAVHKYNTYRPHFSLKGKTPYEYTREILAA